MSIRDLPAMGQRETRAAAKPARGSARKARRKSKRQQEREFLDGVWQRDASRCRATRRPLQRSGANPSQVGEVDHAFERSTDPDKVYDISNGILLSMELNRLRKFRCCRAPEYRLFDYTGPSDRSLPQHFVRRDDDGRVLWETRG